jgi:predicted Zn finger-like uncharacterized protein
MSIQVHCDGCGAPYRVADAAAGRRVQCKKCGHVFIAAPTPAAADSPAEDEYDVAGPAAGAGGEGGGGGGAGGKAAGATTVWDARPSAAAAAAAKDEGAKRGARTRAIVGAVALVAIGVGAIVVVAMNRRGDSSGASADASATGGAATRPVGPAARGGTPGAGGVTGANAAAGAAGGAGDPAAAAEADASALFSVNADTSRLPAGAGSGAGGSPTSPGAATAKAPAGTCPSAGTPGEAAGSTPSPAASPTEGAATTTTSSPRPAKWTVRPNPAKKPAPPLAKRLAVRVGSGDVTYPDQPSPFAVIVRGRPTGFEWEVWDLGAGSRRHAFGSEDVLGEMIVSADGMLAAGVVPGRVNDVEVWSLKRGQPVQRFREAEGEDTLTPVCFVGEDELVTTVARSKRLTVWSIPSGKVTGEIDLDRDLGWPGTFAQSPGGDYLARFSDTRLLIYNLVERALAGDVEAPQRGDVAMDTASALAFSPAGLEVAGLFGGRGGGGPVRVVAWDLTTGGVVADVVAADANPAGQVASATVQPVRPLAWRADGPGWLLEGDVAVGRDGGVLFRRPRPATGAKAPDARWRPGDAASFLVLEGGGAKRMLKATPVPRPGA